MDYIALVVISLVLGLGTQGYINHCYKKYSRVPIETGQSGYQAARRMLDNMGLTNVQVRAVPGTLSDHYDPRSRTVNLSEGIYYGTSVASTAVACHECGHALQHATGYAPLNIRTALVPIANFGSNAWIFFLLAGIFLNFSGLVTIAIVLFAFAVLFQLVTLPVEFNASKRALNYVNSGAGSGIALSSGTTVGARKVLTAAALTYVAAALVSVLQLLYYINAFDRD